MPTAYLIVPALATDFQIWVNGRLINRCASFAASAHGWAG
jgi:hypothetical protein